MSIKRVSDLQKISLNPDSRDNFQEVIDNTYYKGNTDFSHSVMEISWNKNPRVPNNGDDNEFESRAITVQALSAGITDSLFYKDVYLTGRKQICGDVELTGNLRVNKDVDLETNQLCVEIYGYNTLISSQNDTIIQSGHDTIISSDHYTYIKSHTSVIIEIDGEGGSGSTSIIELKDKNLLQLSSGNHLSIWAHNDMNLIYGGYVDGIYQPGELTIWHRLENGDFKPMLQFKGDNVTARGKWSFPESYPNSAEKNTIDGYINHAYYS